MGSRPRADGLAQLGRFACVGVTNTVLSYVVYAALVAARVSFVAAGAIAFCAGAVNGYRLNSRWTFKAGDTPRRRLRYLVVQVASLGATTIMLWLLIGAAGVAWLAAYVVTVPAVTLAAFAANRSWTFGDRRRQTGLRRRVIGSGPLGDVPSGPAR